MGPADRAGLALVELDRQPRIGDVDRYGGVFVGSGHQRHPDNLQLGRE
jgi:hypothetical protein